MPTLSLIIAFRDQVHFLPPLLDSLMAQSFQDFEVILADDASLKKADDVFSRFSETGLRLKLIRREEKQGLAAANAAGFEASVGRYVIFGAADAVFTDNSALQKMMDAAEGFGAEAIHFAPSAAGLESGAEAAEKLFMSALASEAGDTLALYDKMWSRELADRVWPELDRAGLKDDSGLLFNILALPLAKKYAALGGAPVFRFWDERRGSPVNDLEKSLLLWRAALAAPDFWAEGGLPPASIRVLESALRVRLSCVAGRICGHMESGVVDYLLAGKSGAELTDIFKMLAAAADCSAVREGLRREKQRRSEILKNRDPSVVAGHHQAPSPSRNVAMDYSNLKKALTDERRKTEAIVGSLSWRITAPLRAAMRRLKNAPPAGDIPGGPATDDSPAGLHRALDTERQKVKDLTASLSWRLTGPLRKILVAFGRPRPVALADPGAYVPVKVQIPAAPAKAAKKTAKYQYTVVSACYNVEKYLNDYFASLVHQSISFTDHIRLIMVDDGSTDGTADIIKYWQKLFPDNISYLHQENAGQGAARNRGLELVTTPWVTFIDSDDFVDERYFEIVDAFLAKNHQDTNPTKRVKLVGCSFIFYIENDGSFRNTHPLSYKFKNKEWVIPFNNLDDLIHLASNSTFYSVRELERQKLKYTTDRWPLAEDAHFTVHYLNDLNEGIVAFLNEAHYFYRKRLAQDSSLDLAGKKKAAYLDVIRGFDLEILKSSSAQNNGFAPAFIQRSILYDLSWKIIYFIDKPRPPFLSEEDAGEMIALLRQCFKLIDRPTIEKFPVTLNFFNFMRKVGSLSCFKGMEPSYQTVYIKGYDAPRGLLLAEYYCGRNTSEKVVAENGRALKIVAAKNVSHTFFGEHFCFQRLLWIKLPEDVKRISVSIDEKQTSWALADKPHTGTLNADEIRSFYTAPPQWRRPEYEGAWVLMDRADKADDNAEHFYRHVAKNYPERLMFYALRPSSPDWPRLKREGFNLVDPSAERFKHILQSCDFIVSSHSDECFRTYVPNILRYKRLVFLQHGVIATNASGWLNNEKIDLFITSTGAEYRSIAQDASSYNFSHLNTVLTGLARHDNLAPGIQKHENMLLIMPTWRLSLWRQAAAGQAVDGDFMETKYAGFWGGFLKSARLKKTAEEYGLKIVFHPHTRMRDYLPLFELPDYIESPDMGGRSIQELFKKAAVMVSDYSSAIFEMAFLKKPVLYYQFDRDEFLFGTTHTCTQGYFDYQRDGFGPVAETEDALLDELEKIMARGGEPEPVYLERMEKTFPWRDGNNCERIYQEILKLDQPLDESGASAIQGRTD